jgi:hypothetical protein
VRGVTEDKEGEAVLAGLAGEIRRLTVGKALTIAEFAPDKVTVWKVRPDSCGTPRIWYWPRNWGSLRAGGVLDERELVSFMLPADASRMLLARTEFAAPSAPVGRDAERAYGIARAAYPRARAFRSTASVDDLLDEAIASVPLPQWYELVLLRRRPSGRLEFTAQQLFAPGARRADTRTFAVRCEPSDENGTVFAVAAREAALQFRLVSMASAKIPPGSYNVTATLLRPGAVRFDGLPVKLREDTRSWLDVLAAVPERLDVFSSAHLIVAVELCGSAAEVEGRVDRASQLISDVAGGADGPVRFSLLTYAAHSFDRRPDEEPVTVLAWADDDHDVLGRLLLRLRERGPARVRYTRAAQIECLLAEVALRLKGPEGAEAGRPVLVTIGARTAFPHRIDPVSEILPCPRHYDWRVIGRRLSGDHAGMAFGAIRDRGSDDGFADAAEEVWRLLGTDARAELAAAFDVKRFAVGLGLLSPASQYIPFPLTDHEGAD